MRDLVVGGGERGGLLTAGVLGTPENVCAGLNAAFVMQHPLVQLRYGQHQKPKGGRDEFNRITPATIFQLNQNGSTLIGGGLEAGLMPMGEAAGEAGGLRPGVLDARGAEWNGGPLRELTSESPAAHAERDCPHLFVSTNWMLKKGGSWPEKMAHLIEMLVTVTTWMSMGRSCVVHCIPLLFPPRRFIVITCSNCNYLPPCGFGGSQKDPRRPVKISKANRPTLIEKRPEMTALN